MYIYICMAFFVRQSSQMLLYKSIQVQAANYLSIKKIYIAIHFAVTGPFIPPFHMFVFLFCLCCCYCCCCWFPSEMGRNMLISSQLQAAATNAPNASNSKCQIWMKHILFTHTHISKEQFAWCAPAVYLCRHHSAAESPPNCASQYLSSRLVHGRGIWGLSGWVCWMWWKKTCPYVYIYEH